jgi:putative toxin-antitoxin system antitoxin component (TIGR02293 family)
MEPLVLTSLSNAPLDQLDGARLLALNGDPVLAVRAGLPAEAFERLQAFLGVPATTLAEAVAIAPRTLARRRSEGRFAPDESDRLLRTARLAELALAVFEDEEAAAAWLKEPKQLLGGESPLRRADTAPGAREVEDMLYAVEFTAAA